MALDNIRIERLWRSLKYEDIYYLKRYEKMKDLKAGINAYSGIHVPVGKFFFENIKEFAVKFSVSFGQKVTEFLKILTDF